MLQLLTATRRLRPYFQNHQVIVKVDYAIDTILRKPDLVGRMISWSIELLEFGLCFESRGTIRAQHRANFVVELQGYQASIEQNLMLYVDASFDKNGGDTGIVLE